MLPRALFTRNDTEVEMGAPAHMEVDTVGCLGLPGFVYTVGCLREGIPADSPAKDFSKRLNCKVPPCPGALTG